MNLLEGKNIFLRALEPSDLDYIYTWENDPGHWFVSNTHVPFSRYILEKFIHNAEKDIYETKQIRLMITLRQESGKEFFPIGTIDIFDFDPYHSRAGLGILIANKEYRRRGYATEAMNLIIQYAFRSLKLHQLYCNIASDNTASVKLFEKSGFRIIGDKKEWLKSYNGWVDEVMLQLINPDD